MTCRYRRVTPHLYTPEEITALMTAAAALKHPLRALTYQTLIGLLGITGIRVGEACGLDRADVDLDAGVLTIRAGKLGKTREVPLHPSATQALRAYGERRDQLCRVVSTPGFFVNTRGNRLAARSVPGVFAELREAAGIRPVPGGRNPRMHDLRHSFCVATMLGWYRAGVDVHAHVPLLSTYLGHAAVSTYWYLQAAPSCSSWQPTGSATSWETCHELAGPPPVRVLQRQADAAAPGQPAYCDGIPEYHHTAVAVRLAADRQAARRLQHRRPGRPAGRRVPPASGDWPGQQRGHPQRPAGRDPLAVPLRRVPRSRSHAALIQRVLAIPAKRADHTIVCYLTKDEIEALLAAPDRSTWWGRRDYALLHLAVQTGLRVSELTGVKIQDLGLGPGAHVLAATARDAKTGSPH